MSDNKILETEQNILTPTVNAAREFIEIAFDFSNPLDLVREAISNAFDAQAKKIGVFFYVNEVYGEKELKIVLEDDGEGMDRDGLQHFFDLGNSSRRGKKEKSGIIGEKGHGTKVYLNSSKLIVETLKDGKFYRAEMDKPQRCLYEEKIPEVKIEISECDKISHGTKITILGYNNNRRELFYHDFVKDYILWFTKMGSVEQEFDIFDNKDIILELKGVDAEESECIPFGHLFPEQESKSVDDLFNEYGIDAPKWYCKKFRFTGCKLSSFPDIRFDAIFWLEGSRIKYGYNKMLRHSGYTNAPKGSYTVQDRYGLWLCKDYLPIQRKNEWISSKGNEFTRFHAFVNCQDLKLTANRGSIENTPPEIMQELYDAVREIFEERITNSLDYTNIEVLESMANAELTIQKEKNDYLQRIKNINRSEIAEYGEFCLSQPLNEQGVFSLFMQISFLKPDLFPFEIVDYNTHFGIDVIVKDKSNVPNNQTSLRFVEFKNKLNRNFNHSFENLFSIICWEIELNHGDPVTDIAKKKKPRILHIHPPQNENDYTRYYLDDDYDARRIEIFVLKQYLKEKLGIEFRKRTKDECYTVPKKR